MISKCACVDCCNYLAPSNRMKRYCCPNHRTIDNRLKREAVTAPLRAIAALLRVRMTIAQALDIIERQGLAKVTRWLALWGFQWANGRWAVDASGGRLCSS